MRSFLTGFIASLALAGCSKDRSADSTLPPPPEFEAASRSAPARSDLAASDERQDPIAPEDQVQFAISSATLEPAATRVLDDVADWVKLDPTRAIMVKGHADPTGTKAYNLELSSRRADAVVSYLVGRGVARDQIAMVAVGEADAVLAPTYSNRRVVIYALAGDGDTAAR